MSTRSVLGVVVALLAASTSTAGPIQFELSSGSLTVPSGYFSTALTSPMTSPATFSVQPGVATTLPGVNLWSLADAPSVPPTSVPATQLTPGTSSAIATTSFTVAFQLTDLASGEAALIQVHGDAGVNWFKADGGSWQLVENYAVPGLPAVSPVKLGKVQYALTPLAANRNTTAQLAVTAGPIPTPEPSTVVLVGLGLPVLTLLRRRFNRGEPSLQSPVSAS